MNKLRERFLFDANRVTGNEISLLVVAVKLPHGAIEVITNTSGLITKLNYYVSAYDDDFCLKANNDIKIVGYMLV